MTSVSAPRPPPSRFSIRVSAARARLLAKSRPGRYTFVRGQGRQTFGSGRLTVTAEAIKAFAAQFDPQPF
jgi:acyl dehydratase